MWQIRMLGRFEVVSPEAKTATFRSRRVGALLAFLALNKGREVSNSTLQELLWPESDGDRQSQSLRRAIADLRDALESESPRGALVHTEGGRTYLEDEGFETDLEQFEALLRSGPESENYETHTASALALYGGPLLSPLNDDWIFAYRRKLEEDYCRAVLDFCDFLGRRGQGKEAARIAHSAIILAPYREEPYIASIRAYASQDIRASALRQYEALEQMLDDQFGQTPSEEAISAVDARSYNAASAQARGGASGGALGAESRYYIERDADRTVEISIDSGESVVLLYGPRQVGKTSLLARTADGLRKQGWAVVATDFQALGKSEIGRQSILYRSLIQSLATQLKLTYEPSWNEWVGPNSNLDSRVEALLRQFDGPVVWAMDEVDRLFGTEYADDFFGLIRSWHNRRALDPDGPWRRCSLVISYATEAHLFIKDLNQSPFNVGVRVNLRDFSQEEVQLLANRHGESVATASDRVFQLTNGHPFLTRRAFSLLQKGGAVAELRETASQPDGPFGEHLRRLVQTISMDPEITEAVKGLLAGTPIDSNTIRFRLWAAGVLAGSTLDECAFRVPAYESYLRGALG